MAGEAPLVDVAPVATPVAVATVPAVESPIAAPAVDAAPLVAPAESTPVAEPAKVEASPAVEKVAPVGEKPTSMLAEAQPDATDAPVVEQPVEGAAPVFEPFVMPEGVSVDAKGLGQFTSLLAEFETGTKAEHRVVQDMGQRMMDLFVQQKQADREAQANLWTETRKSWQADVKSDPIFGRNRHETFMRDAALLRDKFGTPRFNEMLNLTGAGDHPGMMDFVHNVTKFMDRHGLLREGKPVPAPTQKAIPSKSGPRGRYTASSVQ